jgi:hypothetical protein
MTNNTRRQSDRICIPEDGLAVYIDSTSHLFARQSYQDTRTV